MKLKLLFIFLLLYPCLLFSQAGGDSTTYTTLTVNTQPFHIYSTAYLHYPAIFNSPRFEYRFDTMIFEERYRDSTYARLWRTRSNENYFSIRLKRKPGVKGETWFQICPSKAKWENSFYRAYPEIRVFRNFYWIYNGPMSRKEFKKKYLSRQTWVDLRLVYYEGSKDFLLELKQGGTFDRLRVYPRRKNKKYPLTRSQREYNHLNAAYQKSLNRVMKRFDKKQIKEKARYDKAFKETLDQAWETFSERYMSPEEKKLSREDWLEYYDQAIGLEKGQLMNSPADVELLGRALQFKEYGFIGNYDLQQLMISPILAEVLIMNPDSLVLPVKKMLIVNHNDRNYQIVSGKLGISFEKIYLTDPEFSTIIAELRNGDLCIVSPEQISQYDYVSERPARLFIEKRIPKSLSAVGIVLEMAGL